MEEIKLSTSPKDELYKELLPQIQSLVNDESDPIANMANIAAALKQAFKYYSWVGFYILKNGELVLGPFQGKIACTRIALGKGVCGIAATNRETIIVKDVEHFPGHIYCDCDSKSEIVVPILHKGRLYGVLDVDSHDLNSFDEIDKMKLEKLLSSIVYRIVN
jgi:L-methionine (R)-S-oxide reductase